MSAQGPAPRWLLAANWKMNMDHLQTLEFIRDLSLTLSKEEVEGSGVEMAIFPPFTSLRTAQVFSNSYETALSLGAQDVSSHSPGAFTGEVSAPMLKRLGCRYVLIGHPESRKYRHESARDLVGKAKNAAACQISPILCVGEKEKGERGSEEICAQAQEVFKDLSPEEREKAIVSYEPVWAIGSFETASPEKIAAAARDLKEYLLGEFGVRPRILYGGSVNKGNVGSLKGLGLGGFLVGGASLRPEEFAAMFRCLAEKE